MEIPSKQAIRILVQSFNISEIQRLTAAVREEYDYWQAHIHVPSQLSSPNMPLGKRIRLCLEAMLIEPISPLFRERIENQQVMMRWALNTVSSVVQLQAQDAADSYLTVSPARAFDLMGLEIAKEILDDYLLAIARKLQAIQLWGGQALTLYQQLERLYQQPDLLAEIDSNPPISPADLYSCLVFIWLNDVDSITDSFAGHSKGEYYRIVFEEKAAPTEANAESAVNMEQIYLNSRLRQSISSGFGTAFQFAGNYTEILFEALYHYELTIPDLLDDNALFEKIGLMLVKLASANVDTLVSFKELLLHYKGGYRPDVRYRLDSIRRMADLLPDYNHLAELNKMYPLGLFTEVELAHIHSKIVAGLYQTHDFLAVYDFIKSNPKGDLQVIHAYLTILDLWLELLNQSHIIFTKQLAKQTELSFINSELCPQLQFTLDDERGIQYFYQHIALPTMKRVLAFAQLNQMKNA